jgi:hypothetical protein
MNVYLANLFQELRVGELPILTGLIPLPVHGDLVPIPSLHMAVDRIVAYVGLSPLEPLQMPNTSNQPHPVCILPPPETAIEIKE